MPSINYSFFKREDGQTLTTPTLFPYSELIARMEAAGSDLDLIDPIRNMKASFVPIDND